MLNILYHINRIHKILIFLMSAQVYSLFSFLIPQISLNIYATPQTNFKAPSTPPLPALHTIHISFHYPFNPVLESNESCGAKKSLHPFPKATSSSEVDKRVSTSKSGLRQFYYKKSLCTNLK